jgi:Arc/MetJ family transcription regulator
MARTVINLDDSLMAKAKKLTRLSKKVDVVNYALAELVRQRERARILELRGKVRWEGNLGEMRSERW